MKASEEKLKPTKKTKTNKHTGLDRKHAQKIPEKSWAKLKTHRPTHERRSTHQWKRNLFLQKCPIFNTGL